MRVAVFVKATADSDSAVAGGHRGDGAVQRGARGGRADRVRGGRPEAVVRGTAFDGPGRTVSSGPFAPAEEFVAGFWIWRVKDMDEALDGVKRCPNPMPGPSALRPLYEADDFVD